MFVSTSLYSSSGCSHTRNRSRRRVSPSRARPYSLATCARPSKIPGEMCGRCPLQVGIEADPGRTPRSPVPRSIRRIRWAIRGGPPTARVLEDALMVRARSGITETPAFSIDPGSPHRSSIRTHPSEATNITNRQMDIYIYLSVSAKKTPHSVPHYAMPTRNLDSSFIRFILCT